MTNKPLLFDIFIRFLKENDLYNIFILYGRIHNIKYNIEIYDFLYKTGASLHTTKNYLLGVFDWGCCNNVMGCNIDWIIYHRKWIELWELYYEKK